MSVDPIQEIEKIIGYDPSWNGMVPAEVARKLARQLAEAQTLIENLQHTIKVDRQVNAGDAMYRGGLNAKVASLEKQLAKAREQLAAERALADRLAEAINTLENQRVSLTSYEHPDAPGHSHRNLGRWDKDGSRCAWCAAWDQARESLAAWKESRK